jgi:hypothetical protein
MAARQLIASMARPGPPADLIESLQSQLQPAPDLSTWIQETILAEDGPLHNPDHAHLIDAGLCFLWASSAFTKKGRTVVGQAEQVMFRAGGWQKARQEQQMREWFGSVPEFIITLAADYCAQCSGAEFCALVEHELYHLGQLTDEFGAPAFYKDGRPKIGLRGHDVEEFIGVVQRYGASSQVAKMVEAAKSIPKVSIVSIARSCGTCLLNAA